MDVAINTHFNPFKLRMADQKPVNLCAEIVNRGKSSKKLTVEFTLSRQLAFDRPGMVASAKKKIDLLKPNEARRFYLDVFAKQVARSGEHPLLIKVIEHYHDFNHILNEKKVKVKLSVEK